MAKPTRQTILASIEEQLLQQLDAKKYSIMRDKVFRVESPNLAYLSTCSSQIITLKPAISVFKKYTETALAKTPSFVVECWQRRDNPHFISDCLNAYSKLALLQVMEIDIIRGYTRNVLVDRTLCGYRFSEIVPIETIDASIDLSNFVGSGKACGVTPKVEEDD